jgi:hypothetical protein
MVDKIWKSQERRAADSSVHICRFLSTKAVHFLNSLIVHLARNEVRFGVTALDLGLHTEEDPPQFMSAPVSHRYSVRSLFLTSKRLKSIIFG